MMTVHQIIGLWPSIASFAEDIGERPGNVRAWKRRNSIPAERWLDVVAASKKRGIDLSLQRLAEAAAQRRSRTFPDFEVPPTDERGG